MNTRNKSIAGAVIAFLTVSSLFLGATTVAARTVTTCTSATFHGSVADTRDNPTTVWFEWGSERSMSTSYSNVTPTQDITSNGDFSELVTGLTPNTSYYYRPMASNNNGLTIGDAVTFETPSCGTPATQPTTPTYIMVPGPTKIIRHTIVQTVDNSNNSNNTNSNTSDNNSNSSLGASAGSAGYFFPSTLLGWLLLLIVILTIVVYIHRRSNTRVVEHHGNGSHQ